ncbi:MAG: cobalt transporter subunit CbtB [Alphaproteobacteria bacterium]|nr:cobalt transporter subunit CbtB [Alphaproteobacteria bacterium]
MPTGQTLAAVVVLKGEASRWPAFAAAFLGVFLIFGVGFAGPSVIHNAAHDARHIHAFPCH